MAGKPRLPAVVSTLRDTLARAYRCERGATAIEYSLIAALIAVVIVGAVTALGGKVNGMYASVSSVMH